ncbi:enoyl-CoA hydratase [Thalassospira profundimaris]|uniref:Enoyl-CoA hydratase n=1 Tax=Thalassospira profundimaris TaxID=502049 RepID=A0A367WKE2_9PROT|nr:enoyl-CoA hydratase-related protein [Thalassospira profundimaris]RCK41010.1 enoyl-CoA hydratase [Thalassospira profundimaris]
MTEPLVKFEMDADVAILTLNDPASRNAISADMGEQLHAALKTASGSAKVIVLCGHEKAFCSGGNFSSDLVKNAGEIDAGKPLEDILNPLFLTIRNLPVPLVTAVRGAAAGIGVSLALVGDIIVAGESAFFFLPFRHVGLVPDGGAPWLISRAVGRVRALEMILLAERISASNAYDWGLITRCVPDDAVKDRAMELARNIASGPTNAIALARKAVWAAQSSDFETELMLERNLQREAGDHPNFVEGVKAFREKRPPVFV